ncbi:vesicle tethering protein, C-terminal [Sesbania bispinosa]|nr:vesicle tethering protein, C-terminal [Sesbania bispinosa]
MLRSLHSGLYKHHCRLYGLTCLSVYLIDFSFLSSFQNLLARNASLAEDLAKTGGGSNFRSEQRVTGSSDRVQIETLRRDLHEASQRLEMLRAEKAKVESEAMMYKNLAGKMEADLRSLSDAYNSLEQSNVQLEKEVKAMKGGGPSTFLDVEAIKAEAREEAQKESEGELNDLLVCLGQEQSKNGEAVYGKSPYAMLAMADFRWWCNCDRHDHGENGG